MNRILFGIALGATTLTAMNLFLPSVGTAQIDRLIAPRQTLALGQPVLVELFTSQGCSSCPPADQFASTLARENDLVVIARPVTYWDRLGWKDTLAREANTDLQRDYSRRGLAGRNGVYTPQMVIDGMLGAVGSKQRDVRQQIAIARGSQHVATRIERNPSGGYDVHIGGSLQGAGSQNAEAVLVAISSEESVSIGRGENGGRQISYTNVVIGEKVTGNWNGGNALITIAARDLATPGADRHALIVRGPNGGEVLAARWLR